MLRKLLDLVKTLDPEKVVSLITILAGLLQKSEPRFGAEGPSPEAEEFVAECMAKGCDEAECERVAAAAQSAE